MGWGWEVKTPKKWTGPAPVHGARESALKMANEARELWKSGRVRESIERLEAAQRRDPGNPEICIGLAKALAASHDHARSDEWVKKAFALAPHSGDLQLEAALHYQQAGRIPQAIACLEEALRLQPGNVQAQAILAEISERQHDLDKALLWAEKVRKFVPHHPGVKMLEGRVQRRLGNLERSESLLRDAAVTPGIHPEIAYRCWMETGLTLDRMGRYDDAMELFLRAKKLALPFAEAHWAALTDINRRGAETLSQCRGETFRKWQAAAPNLAPARRMSLLCGHPRSGTTLLEQILAAHPDAATLEESRILHDNAYLPLNHQRAPGTALLDVLDTAPDASIAQARGEYWRCAEAELGKEVGSRLLLDKNPAFNVLLIPLTRIFPEAKLLVSIRDPRDVVMSCFMQPIGLNPLTSAYLSLDRTAAQYSTFMNFLLSLLKMLPQAQLQVRYEDLVSAPEATDRRVLEFLGLPWDPAVLKSHEASRGRWIKSSAYDVVTQPVYTTSAGKWKNYARHLEPHLAALAPMMETLGYK